MRLPKTGFVWHHVNRKEIKEGKVYLVWLINCILPIMVKYTSIKKKNISLYTININLITFVSNFFVLLIYIYIYIIIILKQWSNH